MHSHKQRVALVLLRALQDPQQSLRVLASKALRRLGPMRLVALRKLAQKRGSVARAHAVWVLCHWGPKAATALAALLGALKDGSTSVRYTVARALWRLGPVVHKVLPRLVRACKDPSPLVRLAAARSLLALGQKPKLAMAIVSRGLQGTNSQIQRVAVDAIGKSGALGRSLRPRLQQLFVANRNDAQLQIQIVRALQQMGPEEAPKVAAFLARHLLFSDPSVRREIVEALAKLSRPLPIVLFHLRDARREIFLDRFNRRCTEVLRLLLRKRGFSLTEP